MRVVVGVDLATQGHEWLVGRAQGWARRLGAKVDVVYAVQGEPSTEHAPRLEALLQGVDEPHRGVARLEQGPAADVLVALSEEYDLLVVGSREPGALERMLLGPMATRVMPRTKCPLLVPRRDKPVEGRPSLVVGLDITRDGASALLELAARWATLLDGVLDAVYADGKSLPRMPDRAVRERALKELQARSEPQRQAMEELLATIPEHNRGKALVRSGEPEDVLVALSSEYHFVVIGNRDRSGLARLLLGSVAKRVVRRAETDVLTMPTAAVAGEA